MSEPDLSGEWINEAGSRMRLRQEGARLSGSYRSALGRAAPDEEFPLVGWALGERVAFTVAFVPHGTVTAWVGRLKGDELETLWHLAHEVEGEEASWTSAGLRAGASRFRRAEGLPLTP